MDKDAVGKGAKLEGGQQSAGLGQAEGYGQAVQRCGKLQWACVEILSKASLHDYTSLRHLETGQEV